MAFDIKDPKNQKMLALMLVPIVAIYAFYNYAIQPKTELLKKQKTELVTTKSKIQSIQNTLKPREQIMDVKEKILLKIAEMDSLLPEKENVSGLLEQLSGVENETKVYIVGFKATGSVEGANKPYTANKYQVTIEAGYHQFAHFMSKIMTLPRLVSISDVKITHNPINIPTKLNYEGLEEQPRYLTIDCILTSYIYRKIDETAK